jgi:uncharacterized membrane protein YfcA
VDVLLDPPFAKDPPVKLDIPAKTLGLVYAILGGIGTLFGVFGLLGVTALAAVAGIGALYVLGTLIGLAGTALAAWGGYRMYQADRDGKRLVVYGLVLSAVGALVAALSYGGLGNWIVNAAVTFVLYYLVIISRFEGEPKLVAAVAQPPTERREGPPVP